MCVCARVRAHVCVCVSTMKPEPCSSFLCVCACVRAGGRYNHSQQVKHFIFTFPFGSEMHLEDKHDMFITYTISDGQLQSMCRSMCIQTDFLNGFTSNQKCMFYIIKLQNFEFAILSYQKVNTRLRFCKSIGFPHSATVLYEWNVY